MAGDSHRQGLLDTNIMILRRWLDPAELPAEMAISSVTLAELSAGPHQVRSNEYLLPRTAILGAVLLTGYLGGAICAQLRIEAPLLSTLLFPVYLGVVVWVALYLRSGLLRELVSRSRTGQ